MASFQDAINQMNGQSTQNTQSIRRNARALPTPTTTTSNELKIGLQFADGDTRLIAVQNPDNDLETSNFEELLPLLKGVFIGDKTGAPLSGFYTAYKEQTTKVSQKIYSE